MMWKFLNSAELVFKVQSFFGVEKVEKSDKTKFVARSKFFHYLFLLGTELGDEVFYGIFIPFFFFNVDSFIGRRFVFHWFANMYVGQALKEVFRIERPKSPAIQMQSKWSNEYSLPSTHAMGSLSIAASILYFAVDRYEFNLTLGISFIVLWVTVISLSRVYLGMHSVLDLIAGVVISLIMLVVLLPFTNPIENFLATNLMSPVYILLVPVTLIVNFPTTSVWTPTRGDTCVIAAVFTGIELGTWFNHHHGITSLIATPSLHSLEFNDLYIVAARTVLGLIIVGLTELLGKQFVFSFLCTIVGEDEKVLKSSENSVENKKKTFIDLTSKFITYGILGFNTLVLVPTVCKYFNLQRDSFFNEV